MKPSTDRNAIAIYTLWIAAVILIVVSLLTSGCGIIYGWELMQGY